MPRGAAGAKPKLETPAENGPRPQIVADMEGAVTVAYVHQHQCAMSWRDSFEEMLMYDIANQGRLFRGGKVAIKSGTDGLVESRNMAVKAFLEERQAPWMMWVDTDMGFEPDIVDRLMEAADPVERPMVGALAFTQRELESDGLGGWRTSAAPTILRWTKLPSGQVGFAVYWEYPRNTLVQCQGTGSACVLIHRSVFERVAAAPNPLTGEPFGPVWYNRVPNTSSGQLLSEDLSFCLRVGALQIPIWIHTGVQANHMKVVWVTEETYLRERAVEQMIEERAKAATEKREPPELNPSLLER